MAAAKARPLLLLRRCSSSSSSSSPKPKLKPPSTPRLPFPSPPSPPSRSKTLNLSRHFSSSSDGGGGGSMSDLRDRILLTEKPSFLLPDGDLDDIRSRVSSLANSLLSLSDLCDVPSLLDSRSAADLLRRSPNGFASLDLLSRLVPKPLLALEVFKWRREKADAQIPMHAEEYSKAITLAGRTKNVELAAELFLDACHRGIKATCLYNALMSAYMYNGLTKKSVAVFEDLKRDFECRPTIVTYNILLSVFGRSMLVEHMEAVLKIIEQSDELLPTITTYNTVIAAYITAWMWDKMETTFRRMEAGAIKPDALTHLLMLRGYAHSGNLEKMERTYELVNEQVNDREMSLIRAMVCAYCKSSDPDRIRKIEALIKFIPKEEYRPWVNVLLIRVYAQEGLVENMEQFISEAFERNTTVLTSGVMRTIISGYYKSNGADRLAWFVKQAEYAGWKLCRSLYHCKMVMYGRHNRLEEMHGVLDEMEVYKFDCTRKTFLIMFKAYLKFGRRFEAETIIGLMWKHGFGSPDETFVF